MMTIECVCVPTIDGFRTLRRGIPYLKCFNSFKDNQFIRCLMLK